MIGLLTRNVMNAGIARANVISRNLRERSSQMGGAEYMRCKKNNALCTGRRAYMAEHHLFLMWSHRAL